jgi:ribosomal-protein-alanine N-acetyltransferase
MSAVLKDGRRLLPMSVAQLDAVMAIEAAAYEFPWSRGNFLDSLASGYTAQLLYGERGELLGYSVSMAGVDEMHLLNITTAPAHQHRGHARCMLDALVALCRARGAHRLWLEVRRSNPRAQAIYLRRGFVQVGVRKGYYPAPQGQREDALVMSLEIAGNEDHHALD